MLKESLGEDDDDDNAHYDDDYDDYDDGYDHDHEDDDHGLCVFQFELIGIRLPNSANLLSTE